MNLSTSAARVAGLFRSVSGAAIGGMLALAAFAPAAHAVVVTSPAANLSVPQTVAGIYINVVTGGTGLTTGTTTGWDVNPWGSANPYIYGNGTGGIVTTSAAAGSSPAALTGGTVVGSSSTYITSPGIVTSFALNSTNYFGFRFLNEANGLIHYGYGTIVVGATQLTRTVGNLYYESVAGAPITVSAVPEASTTAMLLAGGALMAGVALRRRRQQG